MSCVLSQEQLYLYLDGELAPAEARDVERHLPTCTACQQAVAAHQRLQALLRMIPLEEDLPARLWPSIQQQLAREAARTAPPARWPTRRRVWSSLGAVTALLLLAWIGRGWFATPLPAVVQEMVDSQIRTRLLVAPYTQLPAHPEAIRDWFRDKVEFAVLVPDLPPERYAFLGVRLNYFLDRRVAELAYAADSSLLSFFMFADAGLPLTSGQTVRAEPRTFYVQTHKGYTTVLWREGDIVCGLVSDLHATAVLPVIRQAIAGHPAS